jgi:hypothetical protein
MRKNIMKFAKEVDRVTKEKMFDIIDAWNNAGLSAVEIAKNVSGAFQDFTQKRALTIARTEVTRASNEASIYARDRSGVVEWKEWYTALDERVCEECNAMHWKTIWLNKNFYNLWDTQTLPSWNTIKYDYDNISWPAIHVNCRCTLLPIIN